MDFILNNWYWITCIIIFVCGGAISLIKFIRLNSEERYNMILGWLLQAVLLAEKEFGSGTGKLKLSAVYDKFCERFPWLVRVISFAQFSEYVDDALAQMKELIQTNGAIAAVVADCHVTEE